MEKKKFDREEAINLIARGEMDRLLDLICAKPTCTEPICAKLTCTEPICAELTSITPVGRYGAGVWALKWTSV